MLAELATIKVLAVGAAAGVPLVALDAVVNADVKIDAPFIIAFAAAAGAAVKWVHGLWRTRKIYREHMQLNTMEHQNTLAILSEKVDAGFTGISDRLDRQDEVVGELNEKVSKVAAATDTVFGMMVELEGRNNARFEALDR